MGTQTLLKKDQIDDQDVLFLFRQMTMGGKADFLSKEDFHRHFSDYLKAGGEVDLTDFIEVMDGEIFHKVDTLRFSLRSHFTEFLDKEECPVPKLTDLFNRLGLT